MGGGEVHICSLGRLYQEAHRNHVVYWFHKVWVLWLCCSLAASTLKLSLAIRKPSKPAHLSELMDHLSPTPHLFLQPLKASSLPNYNHPIPSFGFLYCVCSQYSPPHPILTHIMSLQG